MKPMKPKKPVKPKKKPKDIWHPKSTSAERYREFLKGMRTWEEL